MVFYAIAFFLSGIFIASFSLNFYSISFFALGLSGVFFILGKFCIRIARLRLMALVSLRETPRRETRPCEKQIRNFAFFSLFIIVGAFYYQVFDNYQKITTKVIYGQKIEFQAVVLKITEQGQNQKFIAELQKPLHGKISIIAKPYPQYKYGDLIQLESVIKKPEKEFASYLEKEGVLGTVNFPKTNLIASGHGTKIKHALLSFKEKIIASFQKTLSGEKSAFLAGLTLGERGEFSKEFKDKMSQSGTTHLVALSGYNISILAAAVFLVLGQFFSRRKSFWFSLAIIFGFVVMTGAETSVVRAAVMGSIFLVSQQAQRLYSFRNSIAIAAFFMILFNPKILKFDIGFQLSFAALLGIVYLMPAIVKFFKIEGDGSFMAWKENLITTASAQMAVFPLLILNFGQFSFLSLISNVLILGFIPLTMGLGFLLGFLGMISYGLSLLFSPIVDLLLSYELFIISAFGKTNFSPIGKISILLTIFYYAAIVVFVLLHERVKIFCKTAYFRSRQLFSNS